MIDFKSLKLNNKDPVYIQISNYIKHLIFLGYAKAGDELPSRREIATVLEINPNTAQKAFKLMEEEGFIKTNGNLRSVIFIDENIHYSIKKEFTEGVVKEFVKNAKSNNLSFIDAIELTTRYWKEE